MKAKLVKESLNEYMEYDGDVKQMNNADEDGYELFNAHSYLGISQYDWGAEVKDEHVALIEEYLDKQITECFAAAESTFEITQPLETYPNDDEDSEYVDDAFKVMAAEKRGFKFTNGQKEFEVWHFVPTWDAEEAYGVESTNEGCQSFGVDIQELPQGSGFRQGIDSPQEILRMGSPRN
jgi:hypothetical protein